MRFLIISLLVIGTCYAGMDLRPNASSSEQLWAYFLRGYFIGFSGESL